MTQPDMSFQLKGGHTTRDRRLDRLFQDDPRNNNYPMRRLVLPTWTPRSYTWAVGVGASMAYPESQLFLDQGQEGECVGYTFAHEWAAKPQVVSGVDENTAHSIYVYAQHNDEWPGTDYSGTSVLAGAKAGVEHRVYKSFAWSRSAAELAVVVSRRGPVVLGINWHEGMWDTNPAGFIAPTGEVIGGHAILCKGYNTTLHSFLLHNSWGIGWGQKGCAWLHEQDLQCLLDANGEACLPLRNSYTDAVVW